MKLRLLLWENCNRACKGCCNNDFDLPALRVCKVFFGWEEIILTGGEPMLFPTKLLTAIAQIREQTKTPIYVYTAANSNAIGLLEVLDQVDGITLTLHTQKDVAFFKVLNGLLRDCDVKGKSLRLNVFKGIKLGNANLHYWKVKDQIKWIKNCPLPKDEVFMKL